MPYLSIIAFLASCSPRVGPRGGMRKPLPGVGGESVWKKDGTGVHRAVQSDGGIISDMNEKGETLLRSIIDPDRGSVATKVTIPKNYNGNLYIEGLNVDAHKERFVKIRFKFGRDLYPVTVPAVIARGEGLTPQTDAEFVVLDLSDKPFENIRLRYDLFDYNDYREEGAGQESLDPVDDPRDRNLYCRGLDLPYDPTFKGSYENMACDEAGERCLYAYVKIRDRGLVVVDKETRLPTFSLSPREPQIDLSKQGYRMEDGEALLAKCLPDNTDATNINDLFNLDDDGLTSLQGGETFYRVRHGETGRTALSAGSHLDGYVLDDGVEDSATYVYKGPFRALNTGAWQVSGGAVFSEVSSTAGASGIFQHSLDSSGLDVQAGYGSFLFPRATKMKLNAGVEHLSGRHPFGPRGIKTGGLFVAGETDFMDGCNRRVHTYNDFANENIASCNVTATIELITEDDEGNEVVLDMSREIKLQLIRSSIEDYAGNEVLYTSLNSCSANSSACAKDECCFNNRCWSKTIVTRCLEDTPSIGLKTSGQRCQTDLECASHCCNERTSRCEPHTKTEHQERLCSKAPGQSCLAGDFCSREYLPRCFKVKTGVTPEGIQLCAKRCYHVPTFGNCIDGSCVAPLPVDLHVDTAKCDDAIDPPSNLDSLPQAGGEEGGDEG